MRIENKKDEISTRDGISNQVSIRASPPRAASWSVVTACLYDYNLWNGGMSDGKIRNTPLGLYPRSRQKQKSEATLDHEGGVCGCVRASALPGGDNL